MNIKQFLKENNLVINEYIRNTKSDSNIKYEINLEKIKQNKFILNNHLSKEDLFILMYKVIDTIENCGQQKIRLFYKPQSMAFNIEVINRGISNYAIEVTDINHIENLKHLATTTNTEFIDIIYFYEIDVPESELVF